MFRAPAAASKPACRYNKQITLKKKITMKNTNKNNTNITMLTRKQHTNMNTITLTNMNKIAINNYYFKPAHCRYV